MNQRTLIEQYFRARAESDFQALQEVFHDQVEIYNVYFPVYKGVQGIKSYCSDFQQRIAHCEFIIIDLLQEGNRAMVEWSANLTYKKGAVVAGLEVTKPFILALRGINRFEFKDNKISCLRVYHETTTVLNLLKEHAK